MRRAVWQRQLSLLLIIVIRWLWVIWSGRPLAVVMRMFVGFGFADRQLI